MTGHLPALLHLIDQTLPIGAYTQSNGLETFVQQGVVHDAKSLQEYLHQQLLQNWVYNDGAFLSIAYQAALSGDVARLIEYDHLLGASKTPREIREGSYKLGVRLLKIFDKHYSCEVLTKFQLALHAGKVKAFYPIVFAIFAVVMRIPLSDALYAFYYNTFAGVVTNGVKLIPLSQMVGQEILFNAREMMTKAVSLSIEPDMEWLGACTIASDIRAMKHEHLYTRLYMS